MQCVHLAHASGSAKRWRKHILRTPCSVPTAAPGAARSTAVINLSAVFLEGCVQLAARQQPEDCLELVAGGTRCAAVLRLINAMSRRQQSKRQIRISQADGSACPPADWQCWLLASTLANVTTGIAGQGSALHALSGLGNLLVPGLPLLHGLIPLKVVECCLGFSLGQLLAPG